ncbi:MAG: GspH/FimT family pseudopilin [Thiobacillus sp.]|nr:GspH/FimT family pseudopilin [Thiobacillus sp.]
MTSVRAPKGFTLIEMMVVIAILAILAMMAAPSFNSFFDQYRVKRAAETVNAFLVNTKSEAIKRNKRVSTVVKGSGTSWCIGMIEMVDVATTCNCATAGSCQIDGANRVVDGASYKGVKLNAGLDGHRFIFSPLRGTVAGNATIGLVSNDGVAYNVEVAPFGRVRICSVGGSRGRYPAC